MHFSVLKIQRLLDGEFVVFALCGRIETEHIAQIGALIDAERESVVLDLIEVNLVSRDVVEFLARRETNGVRLKDCPAYVRAWISGQRE